MWKFLLSQHALTSLCPHVGGPAATLMAIFFATYNANFAKTRPLNLKVAGTSGVFFKMLATCQVNNENDCLERFWNSLMFSESVSLPCFLLCKLLPGSTQQTEKKDGTKVFSGTKIFKAWSCMSPCLNIAFFLLKCLICVHFAFEI